ncbi:MAG: repair protein RecO, partial [Aeromicrobium sp.]|nr:repair protein RecO [Aeromicrobium sp.]
MWRSVRGLFVTPARHNGSVALYRDAGIVLRVHKLGEADRIITVLTRERGLVRAVAKGIR